MRVLVFFDLPTITSANRKNYRKFRKSLVGDGFIMIQESVYSKLTLNQTAADSVINRVKCYKPEAGTVLLLALTEKQYARMEYIVGEYTGQILNSDQRVVVL